MPEFRYCTMEVVEGMLRRKKVKKKGREIHGNWEVKKRENMMMRNCNGVMAERVIPLVPIGQTP